MLTDIDAVIFDLDGTLVDSTWVWAKIDEDYLGNLGIVPPKNLMKEIGHMSMEQIAVYFKEKFSIEDSLEVIQETWNEMALGEYSSNVPLRKGADKFLAHLKNLGIKIGLATSNSKILLETVLVKHNIYQYFDSITTTGEVLKGKDSPDVFLLAATRLGVPPERCLVFEDIPFALKAARQAGMKAVAVQDPYKAQEWESIQSLADHYIVDYDEIFKKDNE